MSGKGDFTWLRNEDTNQDAEGAVQMEQLRPLRCHLVARARAHSLTNVGNHEKVDWTEAKYGPACFAEIREKFHKL